jgi:hypothetical protein
MGGDREPRGRTFPRIVVHQGEHPQGPSLVRAIGQEIMRPEGIPVLRPPADANAFAPLGLHLCGRRGAFRPFRRQLRSTRLLLLPHPCPPDRRPDPPIAIPRMPGRQPHDGPGRPRLVVSRSPAVAPGAGRAPMVRQTRRPSIPRSNRLSWSGWRPAPASATGPLRRPGIQAPSREPTTWNHRDERRCQRAPESSPDGPRTRGLTASHPYRRRGVQKLLLRSRAAVSALLRVCACAFAMITTSRSGVDIAAT